MYRRINTRFAGKTVEEAKRSVNNLIEVLRSYQLSHTTSVTSNLAREQSVIIHEQNENQHAIFLHPSALRWHGDSHKGAIAAQTQFQSPGRAFSVRESHHGRPRTGAGMSSAAIIMHSEGHEESFIARSSVNKEEIARFEKVATTWWDVKGPYAGLHAMNPIRVGFIRSALCHHFGRDSSTAMPLTGLRILDVGCGGGLLSEPLARLGADVTGVDASEENIRVAALHSVQDEATASIEYISGTSDVNLSICQSFCPSTPARCGHVLIPIWGWEAEQLVEEGRRFDAVMALEIIEHVDGPEDFVKSLGALCAPNGAVALSTLNRTLRSFALGIVAAEYVAGLVPVGTHSWEKFVTPEEMALLLRRAGLQMDTLAGMVPNPLTMEWRLDVDTAVNYIAFATKFETIQARP